MFKPGDTVRRPVGDNQIYTVKVVQLYPNNPCTGLLFFHGVSGFGRSEDFEQVCKIHPKYKAVRPPTSKKPGCTCAQIWAKKAKSV